MCATGSTDPGGTISRLRPICLPDVIEGTHQRYVEAHDRITGTSFAHYLAAHS